MVDWLSLAIPAAASIGSAIIGSRSADRAAEATSAASDRSIQAQTQAAERALAEQQRQFDLARTDLAPARQLGYAGMNMLAERLKAGPDGIYVPSGEFTASSTFRPGAEFSAARGFSPGAEFGAPMLPDFSQFMDPITFRAPTAAEVRADPGYQFQLDEGLNALDRAAAARGVSMSGGSLREAQQFGQGLASTTYNDVYGRRMQEFQAAQQDAARRFGVGSAQYQAAVADLARRYGVALDSYNAGTVDLTRRYGVATDMFRADQADLLRRQGLELAEYQSGRDVQGEYLNRLASLAGIGQTAIGQGVQAGQSTAAGASGVLNNLGAGVANANMLAGQGRADAALTGGLAVNNALQGFANNYYQQQMIDRLGQRPVQGLPWLTGTG